jgi:PAS domain S-box-containing protein
MNKEPQPHYAFWFGVLGFILGLAFVALATVIALVGLGEPFTLENILAIHLETGPLFWLIDSIPFLSAILLAFIGNRQNALVRNRHQYLKAIHHRDSEIRHLNSVLAKQDEAHHQLDEVIGRGKRDWETTFDAVDDMIIITDVSGKVLRCNRSTSHAFRTNFENIIGQPVDALFFGEGSNGTARLPTQKMEIRFPKLEGWYEVSSSATKLEQDRAATIYLIRNVTDRKQASLDLSRQKEYYESLVRNSPFAIVTLSLDQRIVASNPAFERIFGYSQQEVIGHDIDKLIAPQELLEESQALSESVLAGELVHKVTRRHKKDASVVEVEVYGIPVILWGKQIGILALYHDLTSLMQSDTVVGPEMMYDEYTAVEEALVEDESEPVEEVLVEDESEPVEEFDELLEQDAIAKLAKKPMTEIEGIGPAYSDKLAAVDINTIDQYLEATADRDGRKDLAEKTGISPKLVLEWANRADLMRVPGVGEEFSDLLEQAGVDTVNELKFRNPQNLYATLVSINQEKNLVRRMPSQADVEAWIEAAKQLPAILTY